MTILTAHGSFAKAYKSQFDAKVVSFRELDEAAFIDEISKAKTIIHNAATVESNDLELSTARNFDFTRRLIQYLRTTNPGAHLILLSSMSVLDPTDDSKYGDVMKMTPYAYSKYLAETFCLKSDLRRVSCVRFSTLFFQDPKKDGLSKLVVDAVTRGKITIFNKGEARRNFLPLRVAAQYIHKITDTRNDGNQIYTLAAPASTGFGDVATTLQKLLPKLTVEDKELLGGTTVLSEFRTDSIDMLGRIPFSLENEIAGYVKSLKP